MDFELSDEQRQLADSLERLLAQQYGLDQRKAIIAAGGSAEIWAKIAELGILSLPVSETGGGFGGGAVDLLRPMALLGHALVIEPVIPHLTAARLLDRAAAALPAAAASSWHERLRQSVHGNLRLAWARSTGAAAPACSAQADGDGWRLDGRIDGVVGADPFRGTGPAAALFVSAAGPAGTRLLFLLPAATTGLAIFPDAGLDNQRLASIAMSGVHVPDTARVGSDSHTAAIESALDDAADFESALLCAEAVGLIEFACATTLDYLKARKQFGVPIGSFQALQHRIVDLHVELEQVRSMAALAASKVDAAASGQIGAPERTRAVAAARVLVGKAADKVAQESVQLHGGMGMAEELKVSHTFRRLTVLARQSGSVSDFLDQFIATNREL